MCLRPVKITNPSYHRNSYGSEFGEIVRLASHLTPQAETIEVPCGKCADCRNVYYNSILQRALVESYTSYMYFVTLTYDNDNIPCIVLPSGDVVYYANYDDIQLMFKRFRDSNLLNREFRYLCVNEYGDTNHRPHFHLLLFVARKSDDNIATPYSIEKQLFDNLGKFFAKNIGTRKHPVYKKLYTFRIRYKNGRINTNYFVKYVESATNNKYAFTNNDTEDSTFIKTIRYLIGYVNKGSAFDEHIESMLNQLSDVLLYDKLCSKLRSRIRFSKGFGCGFDELGNKTYLPKISVRASSNALVYSELVHNFPESYEEFYDNYPQLADGLRSFILCDRYSNFSSLRECLQSFTYDDVYNHFLMLRYFPKALSAIIKRYYKEPDMSKISYLFYHDDYKYSFSIVRTVNVESSPTYIKLRSMIDEGLQAAVPYFTFRMTASQSFTAMCKYYKDRVVQFDDLQRLFDVLNVSNYEEWQELFVHQLNLRKLQQSRGNKAKYEKNAENICLIQKNCLISHRVIKDIDLYRVLLSNCK